MGSSGTGNFSDYSNFQRAIKGVTGADDSEDKCTLAFSTLIEDVDTCEYYSKKGTLPSVGTEVNIDFKVRFIVKGFTYSGVVSNASSTPINTVVVDITPSAV